MFELSDALASYLVGFTRITVLKPPKGWQDSTEVEEKVPVKAAMLRYVEPEIEKMGGPV